MVTPGIVPVMPLDPLVEEAIRSRVGASAFREWFGLELIAFEDGSSELALDVQPHHLNPGGIVHGGVIATLLDAAIGLALRTMMDTQTRHVTLTLDVQYLGMAGLGMLTARGTAVHAGTRTGYGEGSLHASDGTLVARANARFMMVPANPDGTVR